MLRGNSMTYRSSTPRRRSRRVNNSLSCIKVSAADGRATKTCPISACLSRPSLRRSGEPCAGRRPDLRIGALISDRAIEFFYRDADRNKYKNLEQRRDGYRRAHRMIVQGTQGGAPRKPRDPENRGE